MGQEEMKEYHGTSKYIKCWKQILGGYWKIIIKWAAEKLAGNSSKSNFSKVEEKKQDRNELRRTQVIRRNAHADCSLGSNEWW